MPNPAGLDTIRRESKISLPDDMREQPPSTKTAASTGRMSRTLLNFWLDTTLLVVLAALGIVATIVQFVFPPGVAARGWRLWNMNYGQWCSVQFALLSLLGIGVLLHVMLHWTWVCSVVVRRVLGRTEMPDDGIRTIYGVGLLIVLLVSGAVIVALATFSIRQPA
ncbi:MAG: DUF4405 domain-containing protein [Planctomycetaceae bacterium]